MENVLTSHDAEFEKLVSDLKQAKELAFSPDIIDTFSMPQVRAVFYMKGICEKFIEKHKDLKMI
jgi:hypothetical protein